MTNQSRIPSKSKLRSPEQIVASLLQFFPHFFERIFRGINSAYLVWTVVLLMLFSVPLIVTSVKVWQQGAIAVLLAAIGWLSVRIESRQQNQQMTQYIHLFLVWLSIVTTLRYLYYRTSYTLNLDSPINGVASILLYLAELYAVVTLVLSYFQTLKLKNRKPVDLAAFPQQEWSKVDVYIPTYNEDVEIVRKTAVAAVAIDYPDQKKQVYVLDDGRKYPERRQELQQMCDEVGCILLTRDNNDHAKAGNINTALRRTEGDLILILDCDHIPSKQILKHTVGFFHRNRKVALVQTPHWFYNPDPFERNLHTRGKVPLGNELFYKVLQKGNDFWNAAFFCGSAAVIRRDLLLKVGGIAVETVTEDCHTSFRLHSLGYETVYYDKIMVAGLAPDKVSDYIGQQVRWSRGMAQILRLENPLLNPKLKLTLPQRICYFAATSHFFFGFPRLIYAIAPTLFLLFAIRPIQGLGLETLAYAAPHILLALNSNYIIHKHVRFSFWNEIFEFVMAYQAGIVTLLALINPKMGSFNVTSKGVQVTKRVFDWRSVIVLLTVTAIVVTSLLAVPFWILLRPEDTEAVLVNAFWCIFNLSLLCAALVVAIEQPQLRKAHRLPRKLPATVSFQGQTYAGKTVDISENGAQILLETWPNLPDEVKIELKGDFEKRVVLTGRIVRGYPKEDRLLLAVEFVNLTRSQLDDLSLVIFSDVREWYSQNNEYEDNPLSSFRFIATSFLRSFRETKAAEGIKVRKRIHAFAQINWKGRFYPTRATEFGVHSLRLELEPDLIQDLARMGQEKSVVGLLIAQEASAVSAERLVAQVEEVETLSDGENGSTYVAIELSFPRKLQQRQERKIKQLVKILE
jgi:cellulose synthase (UDP-forming)